MTLDLVYTLAVQANYDELRYSLRSVEANLPHRTVWLVGGRPRWAKNVRHIETRQNAGKWANQEANLRAAAEHPEVSDPFVMMNDDFFLLDPVDGIPPLHQGTLGEVAARRRGRHEWMARLYATRDYCGPDALAYDSIHVPMVFHKDRLLDVLDDCQGTRMLVRSVYGNRAQIGGERHPNVKVSAVRRDLPSDHTSPFVSTDDRSFADRPIGERIRARFPTPSRYERPLSRLLIVGAGRSGSGYIAATLRAAGVSAAHEGLYKLDEDRFARARLVESSWMALPRVEDGRWDGPVYHQIRDPLAILNSLLNGVLTTEEEQPYRLFRVQHGHGEPAPPLDGDWTGWMVRHLADWLDRCDKAADETYRVEDVDGDRIRQIGRQAGIVVGATKAQRALARVSRSKNKHPDGPGLTWAELDGIEGADTLAEIAGRHGYL